MPAKPLVWSLFTVSKLDFVTRTPMQRYKESGLLSYKLLSLLYVPPVLLVTAALIAPFLFTLQSSLNMDSVRINRLAFILSAEICILQKTIKVEFVWNYISISPCAHRTCVFLCVQQPLVAKRGNYTLFLNPCSKRNSIYCHSPTEIGLLKCIYTP